MVDHHVDADPEDRHVVEPADECADRLGGRAGEGVAERGGDRLAVAVEPLPATACLDVLSLDRLDPGQRLHEVGLRRSPLLGAVLELLADDRGDKDRETREQGNADERDRRQLHTVEEHDRHVDHREDRVDQGREGCAGQEPADLVELAEAGGYLSDRALVEVGEGKAVQVLQHPHAEGEIDPVRRVREEEGPDRRQGRAEDRADDQQCRQHVERVEALLNDHLVDDHLDDHRICQGKDLDEERGDDHLDKGPRVLADIGDERAEAKGLTLGSSGAPAEQDLVALLARFRQVLPLDPLLAVLLVPGHRIGDQKPEVRDPLDHDRMLLEEEEERGILIRQ